MFQLREPWERIPLMCLDFSWVDPEVDRGVWVCVAMIQLWRGSLDDCAEGCAEQLPSLSWDTESARIGSGAEP